MAVYASDSTIILIDISNSGFSSAVSSGFWSLFRDPFYAVDVDVDVDGNLDYRNFPTMEFVPSTPATPSPFSSSLSSSSLSTPPPPRAHFKQVFLRAHTHKITLLEISKDEKMFASAEGCTDGAMVLWDVTEGKKLGSLRPHINGIVSMSINHDCTMIATAGRDAQKRFQIIVWDIRLISHLRLKSIPR